ncbi:MAG: hypothetical protein LC649_00320 [Bacteroidales bacterium]|nr:hypothetical protein [Bacteroidales bacterium]
MVLYPRASPREFNHTLSSAEAEREGGLKSQSESALITSRHTDITFRGNRNAEYAAFLILASSTDTTPGLKSSMLVVPGEYKIRQGSVVVLHVTVKGPCMLQ